MNVINIIIIVAVVVGAIRGYQLGFGRVVLPSAGLLIGFLGGAWFAPYLTGYASQAVDKLLITLLVAFILAGIGSALGERASQKLESVSRRLHLGRLNAGLGGLSQIAIVLFLAWLIASGVATVQAYGIGRQVQTSSIIRAMNTALPPPPDILSRLEKIISPNGFPNVFIGGEPQRALINPSQRVSSAQIAAAEQSVVQINGHGCGGIVEGSGFVINPGVVVTNAHVVAGVSQPQVLDATGKYNATVVYFDARHDVAVLRVPGLSAPALPVYDGVLDRGTATAVLGYPGGGPLEVGDAVVLNETMALGQDIYNQDTVNRAIYELAAVVEPGNSGGPLITTDGQVAGIVFAKSVTQSSVGYALVWQTIAPAVTAASTNTTAVSNGSCALN